MKDTSWSYSVIKNKIVSFEGKWIKLEIIMLNEVSQTQKFTTSIACFLFSVKTRGIKDDLKVEGGLLEKRKGVRGRKERTRWIRSKHIRCMMKISQ
jgi:hypothetical protein